MNALCSSDCHRRRLGVLAIALLVNVILAVVIHGLVRSRTGVPRRQVNQLVDYVRLQPLVREQVLERQVQLPPPPLPRSGPPPAPMSDLAAGAEAPPALPATLSMPKLELPNPAPRVVVALAPTRDVHMPVAVPPAVAAAAASAVAASGSGAGAGTAAAGGAGVGTAGAKIDYAPVPIEKTAPRYPRRALRAGIEGMVTVEFIIDITGHVREPHVIAAEPPGIFEAAVMQVIESWTFPPKYVDGRPAERRARQDVAFNLRRR